MKFRTLLALAAPLSCLVIAAATMWGQAPADVVRAAAVRWLDGLDETQRASCLHPLDAAERFDWNFTPRKRPGVRLGGLTEDQRARLRALLGSTLDDRSAHAVEQIRELERVLFEQESRPGEPATWRDADDYHVAFFGDPRSQERWAWRFEGHHVSLTFGVVGAELVSVTPHFLGASPARQPTGPSLFVDEEGLARELMASFDESQRSLAVLAASIKGDLQSLPSQPAARAARLSQGLPAGKMTDDQRALLWRIVDSYVARTRTPFADAERTRLQAGLAEAHFSWGGSLTPGECCYWRIELANAVLEYDNTQPGANHVHTLWRDTERDFGGAALQER